MSKPQWVTTPAPLEGIWRVGQTPDPLAFNPEFPPPLELGKENSAGNRFDAPDQSYRVLYFATEKRGAFGETLARYRPNPDLQLLVTEDWRSNGRMEVGCLPSDWRHQRAIARATPPEGSEFLNVEDRRTRDLITRQVGAIFSFYGIQRPVDVPDIRGHDYTLPRVVSWWVYRQVLDSGDPRFAGLRYVSRIDSEWECWAVFDRTEMVLEEIRTIEKDDPDLMAIATGWDLTVF